MSDNPLSQPNSEALAPVRMAESRVAPAGYVESGPHAPDGGGEAETGGLIDYWRVLRRRKGALILIGAAGALAGYFSTLPQTPVYQARTTIEIVGMNSNFLNIKEVNPVTESGSDYETSDIQTQVRIIESQSLLERTLGKLAKLEKAKPPQPEAPTRIAAWRKALKLGATEAAGKQSPSAGVFRGLKVRAIGQTRIVEITADSTDPKFAADFVNTLATEFIEQNLEARWNTTQHTSDWLTRQLDDMRVKLERSEDELQGYAQRSGLLYTTDKTSVSEQKLSQLQASVSAAQTDRIEKQSRYEIATASPPESLPDVLNDASLRDYQSKLTELRRQIAEQMPTYTAEHPRVKRLQAQLVTIETALQRERANIIKRIANEFEEAKRKEALLTGAFSGQAQRVTGESEKSIKYNILKREVDSNRQLYDTMLAQLKQSTMAAEMRASNIRVIDHAKPPQSPYKPDPMRSSAVGLLMGGLFGAAFVIARERSDRTIQQPGDAPLYLNLPELGVIPSNTGEEASGQLAGLRRRAKRGIAAMADRSDVVAVAVDGAENVEMVTWQRRSSPMAESFRSSLISILFSSEQANRPKVLVLTSAGPSEGKSSVVSNLAIAIAEIGHRVLLIDADLRKPRQHHIFAVSNDRGLSDVLRAGAVSGNRSMDGVIHETSVPGLFVMPSGPSTVSSTNLLFGPRMPAVLKKLRSEFDTILIDTPPMLQIPDARVIGRIADRVILVVRAGKTTRDAAQAAKQRFSEDGIRVLGTILNDWNPKSSPDGYYGYANGYYGYNSYYSMEAGKEE